MLDGGGRGAERDIGPVRLVRGGVPMHDVEEVARGGLPLLHTTNLLGRNARKLVRPLGRGVVAGHALLLPRVGLPCERHLDPVEIDRHQLSDCVMALMCESGTMALNLSQRLRESYTELLACWGGTGAQYTTLGKLREYLLRFGVAVETPSSVGRVASGALA